MTKDFKTTMEVIGRTVCGYASYFGNVDSAGDIVQKGAFRRSINDQGPDGKNQILFLYQHDKKQILGRPIVLREDVTGLWMETPVIETSYGNDALALIKAGALSGLSIGYEPITQAKEGKYNKIKEVRLMEYSAVTWPCNELARIADVKTALDYDDLEGLFADTKTDEELFSEMIQKHCPEMYDDFTDALERIANKY